MENLEESFDISLANESLQETTMDYVNGSSLFQDLSRADESRRMLIHSRVEQKVSKLPELRFGGDIPKATAPKIHISSIPERDVSPEIPSPDKMMNIRGSVMKREDTPLNVSFENGQENTVSRLSMKLPIFQFIQQEEAKQDA